VLEIFQAGSRQPGQPACPYKRTIIFTIKITTQRDLAYRAVSLNSGPARLPYKQALREMSVSERCLFWRVVPKREVSVLERCPY
jgi:hypothetical protein